MLSFWVGFLKSILFGGIIGTPSIFFFKTVILLQLDLVTYTNKNNSAYFFFSHFNLYIQKYHIDIIGVEGFLFYVIGQQFFFVEIDMRTFFSSFQNASILKKKKFEFL